MTTRESANGNGESELRPRIIAAARHCFRTYGPRRTKMEDVASAAGLSRPALYRYVASRDELIESVILLRIEELAEGLRTVVERSSSFAQAFVEVSLGAVEAARNDPELQALFETTTGTRIVQVMAGPQPGFHEFVKAFFKAAFEAARASGELRTDVSDDAMVDWIRGVYLMVILREDLDPEREREMLTDFLLRSLLSAEAVATAGTGTGVDLRDRQSVSTEPQLRRAGA